MTDRKIVDGFIFFNELSTLNLRLHTLNDYVDYFVIVESGLTHAGNPRPLYYYETESCFRSLKARSFMSLPTKIRVLSARFEKCSSIATLSNIAKERPFSRVPVAYRIFDRLI